MCRNGRSRRGECGSRIKSTKYYFFLSGMWLIGFCLTDTQDPDSGMGRHLAERTLTISIYWRTSFDLPISVIAQEAKN